MSDYRMGGGLPEAFLYMKVGPHGEESLAHILKRKARERETTGRIFWGYGGSTLHPRTQTQPFCEKWVPKQGSVYVLMEKVVSPRPNYIPRVSTATHYSADGAGYTRLPKSVQSGPNYALLLEDIIPFGRQIDLRDFRIGIGDSEGRNAADFIRWHVDKAALVRAEPAPDAPRKTATISYMARLLEPYAVFLRHDEA